ncbi:hypothetical protein [Aurantiacibacter sp. D1-12]|uniref:hypothetical protein n=1 Tax=Aurantiacibacter sp. D1-12 TaxID=2993658 RepID=UPI00237C8607|nr:hypothetical protein [Aurantiacibacter sp. D1-12]MDE1466385.1 hypothetical protein [Aurantiacibacter sp. D1-12]
MKKTYTLARCATSAIAAAVAFGSTQAAAQDASGEAPQAAESGTVAPAEQPILLNPINPGQPVIVTPLPQEATEPAPAAEQSATQRNISAPVVQEAPIETASMADETAATETADATAPATSSATRATAAQSQPTIATPASADTSESALIGDRVEAPLDSETAVLPPVPAQSVSDIAAASDNAAASGTATLMTPEARYLLLGGGGLVVLILLGILVARKRRVPPAKQARIATMQNAKPATAKPVMAESLPATTATHIAEPVVSAEEADMAFVTPGAEKEAVAVSNVTPMATFTPKDKGTEGPATAGASTPLPRSKPATLEERVALIDRIANAKPDRANPFSSMKARRRRARLIVQSLDRKFRNGSFIDFSQYPSNWPHLARREEAIAA